MADGGETVSGQAQDQGKFDFAVSARRAQSLRGSAMAFGKSLERSLDGASVRVWCDAGPAGAALFRAEAARCGARATATWPLGQRPDVPALRQALGLDPRPDDAPSRDSRRNRRKGPLQGISYKGRGLSRAERAEFEAESEAVRDRPGVDYRRPKTRAECPEPDASGVRRCPFVSCRHHAYLDVSEDTGTVRIHYPGLEPHEIPRPCTLDVADAGGATLEEVGEYLGITRERARQIEVAALTAALGHGAAARLADHAGAAPPDRRRLPLLPSQRDGNAARKLHLTGRRSGRLVAIKELPPEGKRRARWLCRCDCGGTIEATAPAFASGHVASCFACRGMVPPRPPELTGPDHRTVLSELEGLEHVPDGRPFDRRERALCKAALRLGRGSAALLAKAAGLGSADEWAVAQMASRGLLRRDGGEYVATEELARLVRNGYQHSEAAE